MKLDIAELSQHSIATGARLCYFRESKSFVKVDDGVLLLSQHLVATCAEFLIRVLPSFLEKP